MRYGIFSDVHSNLEALKAVLDAYKTECIENFLCIGDIIGYAANPKECITLTQKTAMATVAGNHDWAAVSLFSVDYFNPLAREALFWTRKELDPKSISFLKSLRLVFENKDLTMVHGTLANAQDFNYMIDCHSAQESFRLFKTPVCFIGHSHVSGFFIKSDNEHIVHYECERIKIEEDHSYIVNVGSIGQPRDADPRAAYCVYDTDKKEIYIKRVKYDIATARKKILDAGLPQFQGDRLMLGR